MMLSCFSQMPKVLNMVNIIPVNHQLVSDVIISMLEMLTPLFNSKHCCD